MNSAVNHAKALAISLILLSFNLRGQEATQLNPVNFKSRVFFPLLDAPRNLKTADFNEDKQPDIIAVSESGATMLLNKSGSFNEIHNYRHPTLHVPGNVEPGDFNGDGLIDVMMSFNSDSIAVLTNLGNGVFEFRNKYRTGTFPGDLLAADFNEDNRLDVAVLASNKREILIFLNSAQGLLPFVAYSVGTAVSIESGDYNQDGHVDLVVANVDQQNFSILLNTGSGIFQDAVKYTTEHPYPSSLVSEDFNQDGRKDILVSYYNTAPSYYRNTGNSFELTSWTVVTGTGNAFGNMVSTNINNDSYPDLITADWDNYIMRTYVNNDGQSFTLNETLPTGPQPHGLIARNFNNDQNPDVALISINTLELSFNKGDGSFSLSEKFGPGYPFSITSGDFNKDKADDIAAVNLHNRTISVSVNNGTGIFTSLMTYNVGRYPTDIIAHDIDEDGNEDLLVANSEDNTVSVLRGKGDATFSAATTYPVGEYPVSIAIADIDGDTKPDVITGNGAGKSISILLNSQTSLQPALEIPLGANVSKIQAADLNGDMYADIIIATSFGLFYLQNNHDNTFATPVLIASSFVKDFKILHRDGDQHLDLLVAQSSSLNVYKNNGTGIFTAVMQYSQGYECGNISIGDFNGDGIKDVATCAYGNGAIYVLLTKPNYQLAPYVYFTRPVAPLDMVAGNFTDDEKADLALGGWPGNYLAIMRSLPLLKVTVSDTVRIYGDANPNFKSVIEGLIPPDQVDVTYATTAGPASIPGKYKVNGLPNAFASQNYAVLTTPGTLTVEKAPLNVTVQDTVRMFSLPNPAFRGTVAGIKNKDNVFVSYTTPAEKTSPVGVYPITAEVNYEENKYVLKTIDGVLTVTVFVGIEEGLDGGFDIFPNPSRGDIYVKNLNLQKPVQYQVHDSSGRIITSGTFAGKDVITLEVPNGLYYLRFSSGDVRKLIIKR